MLLILAGLLAATALLRVGVRHFWALRNRPAPRLHPVEGLPIALLLAACTLLVVGGRAPRGAACPPRCCHWPCWRCGWCSTRRRALATGCWVPWWPSRCRCCWRRCALPRGPLRLACLILQVGADVVLSTLDVGRRPPRGRFAALFRRRRAGDPVPPPLARPAAQAADRDGD